MDDRIQKIINELRLSTILKQDGIYFLKAYDIDESSEIQKIFRNWLSFSTLHYSSVYSNFSELIKDLDQMYFSNVFISRAIQMTQDEVLQISNNGTYFLIDGAKEILEEIWNLFKRISINKIIQEAVKDLVRYGNAYWVLSIGNNGVEEVNTIPVKMVKERLEFTPYDIKFLMQNSFFQSILSHQKWELLIKNIENKNDEMDKFRKYLLGFVIGNDVLPSWRVIHFRNDDVSNPFYPFGIPYYINSIAPFKQYWTSIMMQMLARSVRFPRQIYKLKMPPNTPTTIALSRAVQFMNQLEGLGLVNTNKEGFGLNERYITIEDLYTFEEETPDMGQIKVDDIELLRDDVILSTNIPRNFLDPNNGSFGNSGIALKQQFLPYGRFIYQIQSVVLQNVMQLVKTHLILINKYSEENFSIQMVYPESMYNTEILSSYKELLSFANEFLDSLAQKLGLSTDEGLPPQIVYMVYSKFIPYLDYNTLQDWFVKILAYKNVNKNMNNASGEGSGGFGSEFGGGDFGGSFGGGDLGGGGNFGGGFEEFGGESGGGGEFENTTAEEIGGEEFPESNKRYKNKKIIKSEFSSKKSINDHNRNNIDPLYEFIKSNKKSVIKLQLKEGYASLSSYLMKKNKTILKENIKLNMDKIKSIIDNEIYTFLSKKGFIEFNIPNKHIILPSFRDKTYDPVMLIEIKQNSVKMFKEKTNNGIDKQYTTKGFNIYQPLNENIEIPKSNSFNT